MTSLGRIHHTFPIKADLMPLSFFRSANTPSRGASHPPLWTLTTPRGHRPTPTPPHAQSNAIRPPFLPVFPIFLLEQNFPVGLSRYRSLCQCPWPCQFCSSHHRCLRPNFIHNFWCPRFWLCLRHAPFLYTLERRRYPLCQTPGLHSRQAHRSEA